MTGQFVRTLNYKGLFNIFFAKRKRYINTRQNKYANVLGGFFKRKSQISPTPTVLLPKKQPKIEVTM